MQDAKPILDPHSNTMHVPFGKESVTIHTPMNKRSEIVSRAAMRKIMLRKENVYMAMTYELFETDDCRRV